MQLTHVFSLHRKYATLFYVPNSLATCLDDIPQTATQMIINYPSKLNKTRDLSSLYTILDANKPMRDHKHLKNEFEFTEELPYADGVFAEVNRDRLQ